MTGKGDFAARIAARLDIPREMLPGGFGVSLSGDTEATVRGCKRILAYGEKEIVLAVGGTVLTVRGEALYCTAFSAGAVTLTGKITALLLGGVVNA